MTISLANLLIEVSVVVYLMCLESYKFVRYRPQDKNLYRYALCIAVQLFCLSILGFLLGLRGRCIYRTSCYRSSCLLLHIGCAIRFSFVGGQFGSPVAASWVSFFIDDAIHRVARL